VEAVEGCAVRHECSANLFRGQFVAGWGAAPPGIPTTRIFERLANVPRSQRPNPGGPNWGGKSGDSAPPPRGKPVGLIAGDVARIVEVVRSLQVRDVPVAVRKKDVDVDTVQKLP